MNRVILAVACSLVLGTAGATASNQGCTSSGGQANGCSPEANSTSVANQQQGQAQGQVQGQLQGQAQGQVAKGGTGIGYGGVAAASASGGQGIAISEGSNAGANSSNYNYAPNYNTTDVNNTVANTVTSGSTSSSTNHNNSAASNANTNAGNNTGTANVVVQGDQAQERNPVSTAVAPIVYTGSDQCLVSVAGGAQGVGFGVSFGMTARDEICEALKLTRQLDQMGYKAEAIKLLKAADPRVAKAFE